MVVRPLRPGDLRALLAPDPGLRYNLAKTRDNLVAEERHIPWLQLIAEQWLWLRRRQSTWVYPQNGGVRGLVSTRNLLGSRFWQVHRLLLASDDAEACLGLLERLSRYGAEQGVQKIFLRMEQNDVLLAAAKQAGFHSCQVELLYRADSAPSPGATPALALRAKANDDDYLLFQLYCAAMPDSVRRLGALSFAEWKQTRERPPLSHRVRELVCYREGEVRCCVRLHTSARKGLFEIILHPSEEANAEAVTDFCLGRLKDCSTTLSLVASFQTGLQRALSDRGFRAVAEYHTLVNELALKVAQPSLAPIRI